MERLALQKVFMQVNECLKWQNCAVSAAAAVACRCMSDESLIIHNEIVNLSTNKWDFPDVCWQILTATQSTRICVERLAAEKNHF